MDYVQIKEWLDKLVDNIIERKALKDFNNQIRTSEPDDLLVYEGLDIIADAIGEPLVETRRNDDEYPYMYSLIYRGIEICAYSRRRFASFKEEEC